MEQVPRPRTLTAGHWRGAVVSALALIAAAACGPTSTAMPPVPAATTLGAPAAAPEDIQIATLTAAAPLPSSPTGTASAAEPVQAFSVAVIVDLQSEPVRREAAQTVIDEASGFLYPLTSIRLLMTDFVEDGGGGSTNDIASRYVSSHAAALPNGIVIFSFGDGGQARLYGGHSYALAGPAGFRNAFVSPVTGSGQVYVAVVHFSHRYAACGYGSSDAAQSATSLDGECRNQQGMACVQHNGYSMCSDSLAHLYASTPTYFVSSTIIHELVHLFAPGGEKDHYSTPDCNTRMGYPEQFFDLQEAQYHNGLCPYVYDEFAKSYQP